MRYTKFINLTLLLLSPLLCLGASDGYLCSVLANESPKTINYQVLNKTYQLSSGSASKQHLSGYLGRYYYNLLSGKISVDKKDVKVTVRGNFTMKSEVMERNSKSKTCYKTYLIHIF